MYCIRTALFHLNSYGRCGFRTSKAPDDRVRDIFGAFLLPNLHTTMHIVQSFLAVRCDCTQQSPFALESKLYYHHPASSLAVSYRHPTENPWFL